MSGVSCIGRMGGRKGDWFAALDFDAAEASIMERTKEGTRGPIATVPLGEVYSEDDDHEAELVPNDEQNRALCRIVFAPEAWRLLERIRETLAARKPLDDGSPRYAHDVRDAELLQDVTDCLACMDAVEAMAERAKYVADVAAGIRN